MDPLVARTRRTVRRFSLISPATRVAVALSGGADSMALLHVLRDMQESGEAQVVGIAHLNHCLRGDAAEQDEAFCRSVAETLGLAFECERTDVRAIAADRGLSIEAAGHVARYEFFERAAERLRADRVALGHTRDDQAETFLLRLLRGAGPRGLSGIHPRSARLIRPMLDCSRRQVRHFVARRGIPFREDATNQDVAIARNLVRHELLPHLARFAPGIVRIVGREAEIARDDADFLDAAAREAFERLVREDADVLSVNADELRMLPAAIARRLIGAVASLRADGRFLGFEHVERVLDLVNEAGVGRRLSLPGQRVELDGSRILFSREPARHAPGGPGTNFFEFSLSIPGEVVSAHGWTVSAERAAVGTALSDPAPPAVGEDRPIYPRSWAMLDGSKVEGRLIVRSWLPGDRFRPLGMAGTRKLQDLFVDRKVLREKRPEVPIVADPGGHIVWVAGHAIAEDFRVTPAASDVVILKLKYWRHGT